MPGPPAPPRFDAAFFVVRSDTGATWGVVMDLSLTGLRLGTEQLEAVGTKVEVFFVWGDDEVRCEVEVVRHCDGGLAVRFLTPDPDRDRVILEITEGTPEHRGERPDYGQDGPS